MGKKDEKGNENRIRIVNKRGIDEWSRKEIDLDSRFQNLKLSEIEGHNQHLFGWKQTQNQLIKITLPIWIQQFLENAFNF